MLVADGAPRHHERRRDHVGSHAVERARHRLEHRLAGDGPPLRDGIGEQVQFVLRDLVGGLDRKAQHDVETAVGAGEGQHAAVGAHDPDRRAEHGAEHLRQYRRAVQLSRDIEQFLQVTHARTGVVHRAVEQCRRCVGDDLELDAASEPHAVAVLQALHTYTLVVDERPDGAAQVFEHHFVVAQHDLRVSPRHARLGEHDVGLRIAADEQVMTDRQDVGMGVGRYRHELEAA